MRAALRSLTTAGPRRWLVAGAATAALALLLSLALAVGGLFGGAPDAAAAKDKTPSVFVRTLHPEGLYELLLYPARVEPKVNAAVLADADGVVTSIHAPLGSAVRTGQSILTLRNVDPAYRYAPMSVVAPVAGVVGQVNVTVGSRVSRGDKLVLVTDPSQVRVTIEVAATDLRFIKQGMAGELRIPGSDEVAQLKVKGVSPFVDPATGTAACELEVVKNGSDFKPAPGMLGRASFKANEHRGLIVAESALTYRGKDPFLRVVRDGVSRHVPVGLGRRQEGRVEVLKGVADGDDVIERASGFVADGERVKVEKAPEAKAEDANAKAQ